MPALAPRFLGIRAKIVKSFARIHKENLVDFGILPLVFKNKADYDSVSQGDKIKIDNIRDLIAGNETEIPVDIGNGRKITALLEVSERQRKILLAGGVLNLARKNKTGSRI